MQTHIKRFIESVSAWKKPRPAVFMHIQKTAGSSIVDTAKLAYGNDLAAHGDYLTLPIEEVSRRRFVSGHFGYDFVKPFMADRFSFTFLRHPLERLVSLYYFCRTRDPAEYEIYRCARKHTFDEFLSLALLWEPGDPDVPRDMLWNHQASQLAFGWGAIDQCLDDKKLGQSNDKNEMHEFGYTEIHDLAAAHLSEFDHIGFQEDFANDCRIIFSALGVRNPKKAPHSNATPSRPKLVDLPHSTIAKMMKLTEIDREIYNTAWKQRKTIELKR